MFSWRNNLVTLLALLQALTPLSAVAEGDSHETGGPVVHSEVETFAFKPNKLDDIFACKDLMEDISYGGLAFKIDLKNPGNGREGYGNKYSAHLNMPVESLLGRPSFLVREGGRTWEVERPSGGRYLSLTIPGSKTIYLNWYSSNSPPDLSVSMKPLPDTEALVSELKEPLSERVAAGIQSGVSTFLYRNAKNLLDLVPAVNDPQRGPNLNYPGLEEMYVRHGSAERVLARMKACADILEEPLDVEFRKKVYELEKLKGIWNENIKTAVQVKKRMHQRDRAIDAEIANFDKRDPKKEPASAAIAPIKLGNNSLNDLFACNDLLDSLGGSTAPIDLKRPGNGRMKYRDNTFSIHGDLLTNYDGKRGFFVRDGNQTYFVPRPKKNIGVLTIGDGKPVVINGAAVTHEYYQNRFEIRPQQEWEFNEHAFAPGLIPVALKDDDKEAIDGLKERLNLRIEAFQWEFRRYIEDGHLDSASIRDEIAYRNYLQGNVARQESAMSAIVKLEACQMALAPKNERITKLLAIVTPQRESWDASIRLGRAVLKLQTDADEDIRKLREGYPKNP